MLRQNLIYTSKLIRQETDRLELPKLIVATYRTHTFASVSHDGHRLEPYLDPFRMVTNKHHAHRTSTLWSLKFQNQTDRHITEYELLHPAVTNLLCYTMSISDCSSEILIHTVMHQRNLTFLRRNECVIQGSSPYRAVNTLHLGHKIQSVNAV